VTGTLDQAWNFFSAGRLPETRRLLEVRLRESPGDARSHLLLGLVEIGEGSTASGLRRIEEVAAACSPPAPLCCHLGQLRFGQGEYARAEAWLRRALSQDPAHAEAWTALGNTLRMLQRPGEAEQAFRRSIALAPGTEDGYVGLAFLLREAHRPVEAAAAMLQLARAAGDRTEVLEKTLGFLEDLAQLELAAEIAERLVERAPTDARLQARAGRLLAKLGRFENAARCYRRAVALDATSDAAYLGLAVVRRFSSPHDPDAVLIRDALAGGGLGESGTICAHFAMGKILDDCGQYDAAFDQFREANERRYRSRPFNLPAYLGRMRRIREAFGTSTASTVAAGTPASPKPVFIVGMMRSGTTLVERILDSHPHVHGAGELPLVESIAASLGLAATDAEPPAQPPAALDPDRLAEFAREYLATVAGLSRGEPVVIDKNPGNFAYLGLLARLFPNARFIHCSRDPLDTCLSIYFQHFAHEAHAWTYDLGVIGEVYADYRLTMSHWSSVLPGRLIELDYGALVRDPDAQTRVLLDFLKLPFDPACLASHRNQRPVGTASVWQARQPVYTGSVGRWRHYATQLAPLRRQLREAGVPIGEDPPEG
jgi:tetratricopeptide (TPR) repeat protein